MIIFLQSLGSRVVKALTKLFICSEDNEETWSKITVKEIDANAKAHYALLQALKDDDISRAIHCTCAYDIWHTLVTTHEGTTKVKKIKFDLLSS